MWSSLFQKHFTGRKWKKYYKNILFYMHCINFGLKPAFMWDFGPESVTPKHLYEFLQDLKESSLICDNIIVIMIDDKPFIANRHYLFESLERTHILMDITQTVKEWTLCKSSSYLMDVINRLKIIQKSQSNGTFSLKLKSIDCLPSIFGLLLGYPLIYYFNYSYPNFPVFLILYKIVCRFECLNVTDKFQISSFSIPKSLFNDELAATANEWFHSLHHTLRSANAVMFQSLKIECSNEYVNSLNL